MQGRIRKKLEAERRTLLRYVCEAGSWSSGIARKIIVDGDITVNGQTAQDPDLLLEARDAVSGY